MKKVIISDGIYKGLKGKILKKMDGYFSVRLDFGEDIVVAKSKTERI